MSATDLISRGTEGLFLLLMVITVARAVRSPRSVKVHTAAFFVVASAVIVLSWVQLVAGIEFGPVGARLSGILLLTLPYLMLRLADDFGGMPRGALRAAEGVLALAIAGLVLLDTPYPVAFVLFAVAQFAGSIGYAAWRFRCVARDMRGVSRLRLRLASWGSVALALNIVIAGVSGIVESAIWTALQDLAVLALGLCYYGALAMPGWMQTSINARPLQRFLPALIHATPAIVRGDSGGFQEVEAAVAEAMGTRRAFIALWSEEHQRLVAPSQGGPQPGVTEPSKTVVGRAYQEQRAVMTEDAAAEDPQHAEAYRAMGARIILSVPVTLDDHRFGMLTTFSQHPPFIQADDLTLLQTMADQLALVLRDRELLVELSKVRAQEETLRLKDEFFAAAAHDLKTPLTTVLGQAQRLQRQIQRRRPVDEHAIESVVEEAQRMRRLVEDLLDEARLEHGRYVGERVPTDLFALACEAVESVPHGLNEFVVRGEPTVVPVDAVRMKQVLVNLAENATKYSPDGGEVAVSVGTQSGQARIEVADHGVGIPEEDLAVIFERFSRGSRGADGRFDGLGVGLYLCRRIVEEHDGTIEVASTPGVGSTFIVRVPLDDAIGKASCDEGSGYAEAGARD